VHSELPHFQDLLSKLILDSATINKTSRNEKILDARASAENFPGEATEKNQKIAKKAEK